MPRALISFIYVHLSRYFKTLRTYIGLFVSFHITHASFSTLRMDVTKMRMRNGQWEIEMENGGK